MSNNNKQQYRFPYLYTMTKSETASGTRKGLKNYLGYFRNKYLLTVTLFTIYALFLDDQDVFTLISQNSKLSKIKADQELVAEKLAKTTQVLKQLDHASALERYAREEKLFKKDNEDVFIISHE